MSKSHDQKQQMLQLFDKVARTYHTVPFFQAFGQSMVAWSGINQGQTILDIATGRGAVLMPALAAIGPEGRAIAIDSSPRMIEELTHDLRHADANNVHLRVMDAEVLDFSAAHFDAVLCGFAMHLFPYPQNALAEIDRVLKPGGMFVFSVPGPRTSDRWDFYADTITRFQPLVDSA